MRMALGIEYDGSRYCGWQKQPELATIQTTVEKALSKVADHRVNLFCAGRTDTGVHATGQVVHFDTEVERSARSWIFGTNSNLPSDISVCWAKSVSDEFNARFSAVSRRYRYLIHNHPVRRSILRCGLTWHYRALDENLMAAAAEKLIGEHDFTSFRALGCQAKSPLRTVQHFTVERRGDLIILDVKANAFLHHMVRNMVGVLMAIGAGKNEVDWVDEVLAARNRSLGGVTAPPYGLYLVHVEYPPEFELENNQLGPFFIDL